MSRRRFWLSRTPGFFNINHSHYRDSYSLLVGQHSRLRASPVYLGDGYDEHNISIAKCKHSFSLAYESSGFGFDNDTTGDVEHRLQLLCGKGQLQGALNVLCGIDRALSTHSYILLLKGCKNESTIKQVYNHVIQYNDSISTLLGDYLSMATANIGLLEEALCIFSKLTSGTVFSWTAIVSAYVDAGQPLSALKMYERMVYDGVPPNTYTFVSILKACGCLTNLKQGKMFHCQALMTGLASHSYVGSTIVSMYGKYGAVAQAEFSFADLLHRDPVAWNAMLTTYGEQHQERKALRLYRQMHKDGIIANCNTYVFTILACSTLVDKDESLVGVRHSTSLTSQEIGEALHADVRKNNLMHDMKIRSALVSLYGRCGSLSEAHNVFTALPQRDAALWNAMIAACVEHGEDKKALHLYKQMQEDGINPDQPTFVIILQACSSIADKEEQVFAEHPNQVVALEFGRALHTDAYRMGHAADVQVVNTLITMYGKCGAVEEAESMFSASCEHDLVSWTALLCMYVKQGCGEKAVHLYKKMQKQNVPKDNVALIATLEACGLTCSLEVCRHLHFEIVSSGYDFLVAVASALLIAYRSCADMVDAQACFDRLSETSIVLWNACIAGHASAGNYIAALSMFENMKYAGLEVDDMAFISALSACRYTGLVCISIEYFESIIKYYGLIPKTKHYGILLDLLGRAGDFKRLENLLQVAPSQFDMTIWLCLLGACLTHGKFDLARQAFKHALDLNPNHSAAYVFLSNISANPDFQNWETELEHLKEIHNLDNYESE